MSRYSREAWETLGPLLDQALDLPPGELGPWLEALRRESPAAASEVLALLSPSPGIDLLNELAVGMPSSPGSLAGSRIGPYQLERVLGRGGTGTVWLARRRDQRFEGTVAIKLLNLGLVGDLAEERFRREGQVLATLNHPNIAHLIDAGVREDGQPYLVLEHVDGQRIDRYCDERKLPPKGRIRLMLDVLAAVAHAHANLVVHRDLKPSNILVRADGTVKLLDFGIAKLIAAETLGADSTELTRQAGRALTPEYAAPEQFGGEAVTTATDVYSLGVVLYRLLTGRHPSGFESWRAEPFSAAANAPIRASLAVLSDPEGTGRENAVARGSVPERLAKLYRGDLDNILAKSLRREPGERYGTADAFADDLRRFLALQPVAARPLSLGIRLSRFVRRNRVVVAAAGAAAVSLVAGTIVSVRQMLAAEAALERAERAARRRSASVSFESIIFRLIQPEGEPLTYRQLLERGRDALEREYRTDPIARIELSIQFAQNYLRTDDVATARSILERAKFVADSIDEPRLRARTRCELGFALSNARAFDSARAVIEDGRRWLSRVSDPDQGDLDACDGALAEAVLPSQPESAVALFRRISDRIRAKGDTMSSGYRLALNDQARALLALGQVREVAELALAQAELARRSTIADPTYRATLVYNAAYTFGVLGEHLRAREILARELTPGPEFDSVTAANSLIAVGYGFTLLRLAQEDSARHWLERRVASSDAIVPRGLRYRAHSELTLLTEPAGAAARSARHLAAADSLARNLGAPAAAALGASYRIRRAPASLGPDELVHRIEAALEAAGYGTRNPPGALAAALIAAADRLVEIGRYEQAAQYATDAGKMVAVDSLTANRSAEVGFALFLQARAAAGRGDSAAARSFVTRALPPLRFGLGENHPRTQAARTLLTALSP